MRLTRFLPFTLLALLPACARVSPAPIAASPTPAAAIQATPVFAPNLDPETQTLIARADRVVFVIPFSHWDTDWHQAFPDYVKGSDQNILAAIQMAKQNPRFRYTFEQALFVEHFWDSYPQYRADLKILVQKRQLTFAWAGITQPETSLTAPAVQVHNLQQGQDWIAATFGPASVPRSAWQSDAFGNSAALPIFLTQFGIPYLFIGRWQGGCDPDYNNCVPLPHAFYWKSPVTPDNSAPARVLVAYLSYPTAWDAIHKLTDAGQQLTALRQVVEGQFKRTNSKYVFLPMGSDFIDPLPNLPSLVERWNASDQHTVLVMADPDTAFQYLATQNLPELTTDLNPIWQAFYGTRPAAKIADKESEYFLTTTDKFGLLLDAPQLNETAWLTATINAHYDNIGAVSFDSVWESTQRPRFEQTVATAADELSATLARIASGLPAFALSSPARSDPTLPVAIFNPASWPRSEVVEVQGDLPDPSGLPAPVQRLGPNAIAFWADSVPPIGFASMSGGQTTISHPAAISQADGRITLTNGLVTVSLDPAHGGTFSSLALAGGPELLDASGDDVAYLDDSGDVYGAFFGQERARESQVPAHVTILAGGPLIARAQAVFALSGQPITKTVTLRADDPRIDVTLEIRALPESTALLQTPTTLTADNRTDDLGFAPFEHPVDTRPIVPGDVTYRRKIFYPIIGWSDVSDAGAGLTLITHGLQGVGGAGTLNLILVRQVFDHGQEGVTDPELHTLRYAYLPHAGTAADVQPWRAAYAFNQPLIPVWRSGQRISVQLPFDRGTPRQFEIDPAARSFPASFSLISAQGGLIADLYRRDGQVQALVLNDDPATPATIFAGGQQIILTGTPLTVVPVELNRTSEK